MGIVWTGAKLIRFINARLECNARAEYILMFFHAVNTPVWLGAKGGRIGQCKYLDCHPSSLPLSSKNYAPALE